MSGDRPVAAAEDKPEWETPEVHVESVDATGGGVIGNPDGKSGS